MPSEPRKSLMGGYTSWSDPLTSRPLRFIIAASVAMAVPQMPMKWMRSLNGVLLDDQPRALVGDDPTRHAERQRHGRAGGVTRGKADENRPWKVAKQIRHHRTRGGIAGRLVALRQLADHDSRGAR